MKTLAILLLLSFDIANAQTVPSSCDAPDSVKELYRGDAAWSAIVSDQYSNSFIPQYKDSTEIPKLRADSLLNAVLAVKNALHFFPKQLSYYVSQVHQYSTIALREIYIEADTSYEWCRRLAKKEFPTGNSIFDSMVEAYGIEIDFPVQYLSEGAASIFIQTNDFYNTYLLSSVIDSMPGIVRSLWSFPFYYEKHFLMVRKSDKVHNIFFSYGWGGCGPYCKNRHNWIFTVFDDCSVRLDSSYGDVLPSLEVSDKGEYTPSVYPNPATNKLTLEAVSDGTAVISDVNGKELAFYKLTDGKNELVISQLASGFYFVTVKERSGNISTLRFIKE